VPRILYSIINLYFLAQKVDSDIDSEEENDDVQLMLDEYNYPILPSRGNLSLLKSKHIIRTYWTLTYRKSVGSSLMP
jgi:hypothetical protein